MVCHLSYLETWSLEKQTSEYSMLCVKTKIVRNNEKVKKNLSVCLGLLDDGTDTGTIVDKIMVLDKGKQSVGLVYLIIGM